MRSYRGARWLFSFFENISWCLVVFGLLIAGVMLFRTGQAAQWGFLVSISVLGAGAFMTLIGLFGVALAQTGRAGVDSAEYSQQMLQVARDQLEVSRQALLGGRASPASFAATAEIKPDSGPVSSGYERPDAKQQQPSERLHRIKYKGKSIAIEDDTYIFDGLPFETREAVEAHIDGLVAPELPGLSKTETAQ